MTQIQGCGFVTLSSLIVLRRWDSWRLDSGSNQQPWNWVSRLFQRLWSQRLKVLWRIDPSPSGVEECEGRNWHELVVISQIFLPFLTQLGEMIWNRSGVRWSQKVICAGIFLQNSPGEILHATQIDSFNSTKCIRPASSIIELPQTTDRCFLFTTRQPQPRTYGLLCRRNAMVSRRWQVCVQIELFRLMSWYWEWGWVWIGMGW